ncbi:MAG: AraC family transcriptional regulator [Pseudomonas sp.]|nr:MAG: AraC family transcriptional regulator [Pseudomonas sp.]
MTSNAIADALQLHLLERYGIRRPAIRHRPLTSIDTNVLVDAVRNQLGTRINLETLAALVDMEVRPFTSAFRQAFGLSPWQYVLQARLSESARLLRESNLAVTEIALAVGFATPSHFSTAFTGRFGVPPSRYRQIIR